MTSTQSVGGTDDTNTDSIALHRILIEQLISNGSIKTAQVEVAFQSVPRHLFLPQFSIEMVYKDQAIPTKLQEDQVISSSSQPTMMAIMLEQLEVQPGHNILEIGAGTGFNAALMAHITGNAGHVTTIEMEEDITNRAQKNLSTAGFNEVQVICGDGMAGYPANAPYDRIIMTVGGWDIPPGLLEQLKPDGRILLPLSINGPQISVAFERDGDHLTSVSAAGCSFMRIRGKLAEPQSSFSLGSEPGLLLEFNKQHPGIDPDIIYNWLTGKSKDWATGITTTLQEVWSGLGLWLGLHESYRCMLIAQGKSVEQGIVPYMFGKDGKQKLRMTTAKIGENGICLLSHPPEETPPLVMATSFGSQPLHFELYIRSFGSDETMVTHWLDQVQEWDYANRPDIDGIRIRAYPVEAGYVPQTNEYLMDEQWHQYVIDWPFRGI